MIRRTFKIAAYVLMAAFLTMAADMRVEATSMVLPSGGIDISLARGQSASDPGERAEETTERISLILDKVDLEDARKAAGMEDEVSEDEDLMSLVIAQVDTYANIRSLPDENGESLGKLYHNGVGTLIGEENGWYEISSGSVTGYVKADLCVAGEAAIELAKTVSTRIATISTDTLKVRREPDLTAEVLTLMPENEQLEVLQETEDWVQVDTEEGTGWVLTEYCVLSREFEEAESKEEEAVRLKKESEERKKAQKAAAKSIEKEAAAVQAPSTTTGSSSELGQAVVDYAMQFVGNPYVYGGTSLTKGADCSGFVMSVYAAFGVSLPHSSAADRKQGYAVDGLANAQPGDLVCYSGHVALYAGDGQIVHAANSRKGIIVSKANYKKVLAVRRIF